MVVATATTPDRKIVVVDLNSPDRIYNQIPSPLKYQSRCIAAFPDQQGFCLGSIEGRVAVHHVSDDATSTLLLPTLALTLSPGISARQSSPLAARALAARRSPLATRLCPPLAAASSRHSPLPGTHKYACIHTRIHAYARIHAHTRACSSRHSPLPAHQCCLLGPRPRQVHDRDSTKNFAFKCHREGTQDIFAVNHITFHPTYGTFATTGSDGTFNFWDKDSRQRLKAFAKVTMYVYVPCMYARIHVYVRDGRLQAAPQGLCQGDYVCIRTLHVCTYTCVCTGRKTPGSASRPLPR